MRVRNTRYASNTLSRNTVLPEKGSEFSLDLPPVIPPDSEKVVNELHEHHKRVLGEDVEVAESQALSESHIEVIEPRKLDLCEAERLLLAFRHKSPFFPFVIIPDDATVSSLSRTSPFLLLAVLTVASGMDTPLNFQMDQEFRRILSAKVVVDGQKSLDFLQGILIYIAWYPIHLRPKNSQAFMYMGLAISLIVDIGLDKESPNENSFHSFSSEGLVEGGVFTAAAKSAYLGCYYLSASLSMGFQKPNNLQYRNLMDSHGASLLESDCPDEIYALVKLLHLIERIAGMQRMNSSGLFDLANDMNIQMFMNGLQEWRAATPAEIRNLPHVALADHFANITVFSHELGFLRRHYPVRPSLTSTQTHQTSCLAACKTFFETLLSIPEDLYPHFSAVQYAMIIQAILVLSRLTFLIAATMNWDSSTTRSNIPMVMYLDALCYRFHALSPTQASGGDIPKHSDALYILAVILRSVKRSYTRRVDGIQPTTFLVDPSLARGPHCPMKDRGLSNYFDHELDSAYGGDLSGGSVGSVGSVGNTGAPLGPFSATYTPLYHDLWATMTCSWAQEF